mmetsp:Transcript_5608/g.16533  ORF Transcript_5608/g.16533 Transcript_5608/m.16533 type:complete len:274 (-) Transcript_5608:26-847(-)
MASRPVVSLRKEALTWRMVSVRMKRQVLSSPKPSKASTNTKSCEPARTCSITSTASPAARARLRGRRRRNAAPRRVPVPQLLDHGARADARDERRLAPRPQVARRRLHGPAGEVQVVGVVRVRRPQDRVLVHEELDVAVVHDVGRPHPFRGYQVAEEGEGAEADDVRQVAHPGAGRACGRAAFRAAAGVARRRCGQPAGKGYSERAEIWRGAPGGRGYRSAAALITRDASPFRCTLRSRRQVPIEVPSVKGQLSDERSMALYFYLSLTSDGLL